MIDFRIWQIAGWTMLHYLWVGAVLGLLAATVRLLLQSCGANLRYLAALGCFAILGIAPLPIALVVSSRLPPPPRSDPLVTSERAPDRTPLPPPLPAIEQSPERVPTAPAVVSSPPLAPAARASELVQSALDRAAMGLPWLWLIGAPLTFLLTTIGLLGAERLRRQSHFLEDSPIAETCRRLAAALGISRRVGVAICDRIAAPILLGIFRPLILLPAVALTGWDPQQLEMVLLHELAHVRRWDNLVNLMQRVVESLLFFHPLVWTVSTWVRREREHCCDEVVVARTRQPRAYAEMLVSLSERVYSRMPHGQVVSSMAERPLVARIRRILKKEEQSMQVSRKTVALVFVGLIGIVLVIGGYCSRTSHAEDGPVTSNQGNTAMAKPVGDEKSGGAVGHAGKPVDKRAAEIMQKFYLSREWIERARSFRIHSDYKDTPTAEGLRRPAARVYGSGKLDPRAWCMKDEWAWDESHILHRSQSHHDGDSQLSGYTTAWNGSLAISCQEPEPPDQKHYGLSNKASQFFEQTALFALLPWGPGDGYHFWWLGRDAAKYREGYFTAPEDFELAGQEDVQGRRCHVLQSRAGLVRLFIGVADGRLYRREILVSHDGAARQLAIGQKIGGASIKTLKDWWDWEEGLKPQDRVRAYRSFQEAQFERAQVMLRQTFDDYREVAPGCWLSFRQRMDSFATNSAEPILDSRAEQTIAEVALNQPLPLDLFHIDLPEGAQVVNDWRYDPPIQYTYRKDQTEAQRVALQDAARPPGYQPNSETPKLPEGADKKPEVNPKAAPKASDPSGKTSDSEEEVRRLAAAYIKNRDSFRRLECTYELRLLPPGKEEDNFHNLTKPVATATGLLVRDGSTVRTEVSVSDEDLEQSFKDGRIVFPPRAVLLDNQRGITYSKIINGGVLYSSASPPEKGGSLTPFSFGRFTGADEQFHPGAIVEHPDLQFEVSRFEGKVPKEPYAAAGPSELVGVEYSQKLGARSLTLQFFLAPAKGFLPIISTSYLDGKAYQKSVVTDVRLVGNDRAYPLRSLNYQCGPGGQVGAVTETRVTKLRVDEPVDPSLLPIMVPTGALIRDAADDNSQFKVPHGGLVGINDLDAYFALAAKQSKQEKQEALRAFDLKRLKPRSTLEHPKLSGTKVTDEGVKKLQQTPPNSGIDNKPGDEHTAPAAPTTAVSKANDPPTKSPTESPADNAPPASGKSPTKDGESTAVAGKVISDPIAIAAKLTEIRDIARRHEKRFENLRVNGTFEPNHEQFLVVVGDGKYRHDREVVLRDGRRVKSYWLDDGKTAFSFSENLLVMDPTLGEGTKLQQNLPGHLAVYLTPQAGPISHRNLSVSQYCDALLAALGTEAFGKKSVATLRLRETGRRTVISIEVTPDDKINDETAVTLDADKNYAMTRYWDRSGSSDKMRQNDVHSEYRELAPGVFFLSKGTWWQKASGKKLEELGEAHEGRMSIAIDSVEFGNFPVSDTFFDVHHWPPIKLGINVHDSRAKPPRRFVYDKGPFDATVLRQSPPK